MAKRFQIPQGSWLLAEELLSVGDPAFVDELCRIHDADRLGTFAKTWYHDKRPASRRLMQLYLSRPLATYRHEALVKRLFKLAEAAGDDEVMGWFLVALDRALRRVKKVRRRYDWSTRESWTEEAIQTPPDTTMPRQHNPIPLSGPASDESISASARQRRDRLRLFSVATRGYLRRRVWRYFRELGKRDPDRYVEAISQAIVHYTDEDCSDGLALLDNWGLVHVLFHHSNVLRPRTSGWQVAEGRGLSQLRAAPAFPQAWERRAEPLLEVLGQAQSRPLRQWAMDMLRRHHPAAIAGLPVPTLLGWIGSDDAELAAFAAQALTTSSDLSRLSIGAWLQLIEVANPQVLDVICDLVVTRISAESVSLQELVHLACARPVPVARLGLHWLSLRTPETAADCRTWLRVAEAQSPVVRGELVELATHKLQACSAADEHWVLELLDSRHADVRGAGWRWFLTRSTLHEDVEVWQKLLENPYDEVRLQLIELLQRHTAEHADHSSTSLPAKLDARRMRQLWASVLLNIHRGGRHKPAIVAAVVQRMEHHPHHAAELLPLLAVALRSVRSVEFRAGLAGVVQLVQRRPELLPLVEQHFPELTLV